MELDRASAYVITVPPDRTIHLPEEVPVGAAVALILLPAVHGPAEDEARRQRFERTHAAIRAAEERMKDGPAADDATVSALVDRARRA